MKHGLVLIFLLFSTVAFTQDLEGVWGLKFGISMESAKEIVEKKTSVIPRLSKEGDELKYTNVTFGSRKADMVTLIFDQDKLIGATIFFVPSRTPELFQLYNNIKRDLAEKYWQPQTDVESYKSPYEKGDGRELAAIKGGYSTIGSLWYFPKESTERNSKAGIIMLTIEPEMMVTLAYRGGEAYAKYTEKLKQQSQSDY